MADKPDNLNKKILESKLDAQKADALEEISRILKNVDNDIERKERGEAMILALRVTAESQVSKRTKEILDLREKQAAEKNELTLAQYERLHKNAMDSLIQRLNLAVQTSGGDMDSFRKHSDMFKTSQDTDFFELLKKEGITVEEAAKKISPDLLLIEQKLKTGNPPMDESDWSQVERMMRAVAKLEPVEPRKALAEVNKYAGYVLLSELAPEQRTKVLERMQDDPGFHKLVINFTATNYLTVAEGLDLLAKAEPKHPELKDQYILARTEIDSDGMRRYQSDISALQKEALKVYDMNYSQNYAGKYLNPETYLLVKAGQTLGAMTMISNFLANVNFKDLFTNPSKFMSDLAGLAKNPCFLFGTAITAGTVEYVSGGIGKGWLSAALKNLTDDKSSQASEKEKHRKEQIQKVLGNYPQITEFYYRHRSAIVDLKNQKKQVTLEALGIHYKDLPDNLKTTTRTVYDDNLDQFATAFMDAKIGLGLKTADEQKTYINQIPGFINLRD